MHLNASLLRWGLLCLALCACPAPANEAVPANLEVFPPDVSLLTSRARQVFVVQATYPDGITRDVTAQARATVAAPNLVKLERNLLTPLADGTTELQVEFAGPAEDPPQFRRMTMMKWDPYDPRYVLTTAGVQIKF